MVFDGWLRARVPANFVGPRKLLAFESTPFYPQIKIKGVQIKIRGLQIKITRHEIKIRWHFNLKSFCFNLNSFYFNLRVKRCSPLCAPTYSTDLIEFGLLQLTRERCSSSEPACWRTWSRSVAPSASRTRCCTAVCWRATTTAATAPSRWRQERWRWRWRWSVRWCSPDDGCSCSLFARFGGMRNYEEVYNYLLILWEWAATGGIFVRIYYIRHMASSLVPMLTT